jgi:hypothetical protein
MCQIIRIRKIKIFGKINQRRDQVFVFGSIGVVYFRGFALVLFVTDGDEVNFFDGVNVSPSDQSHRLSFGNDDHVIFRSLNKT